MNHYSTVRMFDDGVSRYWMLETIKEYAHLCLEKNDEADAYRQRHSDYFLELAAIAEPELRGSDQRQWLGRLGREHNNLSTALRWFVDHDRTKESLRMGSDLVWHWFHGSYISEGKRWILLYRRQILFYTIRIILTFKGIIIRTAGIPVTLYLSMTLPRCFFDLGRVYLF